MSLKSPLIAGAASAPPYHARLRSSHLKPCDPPTTPKQVGPLFTPTSRGRGTGNTNPPIVPYHAPPVPNGDSWGGDRSAPIGAVQVRCPMPEAWLLPIGQSWLLFSNQLVPRAPLTRDRPFACVALVSKGNPPMNVSTEHILLAERSRGTTSGS